MKKIKLFPAPHLELKIFVSRQMEDDLKHCKKLAALPGSGPDCEQCSWQDVKLNHIGMCVLPEVHKWLLNDEQNEK